jgi:mono/diheme cytochrome c family protein
LVLPTSFVKPDRERIYMKRRTLMAVLLLAACTAVAKDGASIYKSKCAGCHGAQGEGKTAPKLAGTSLSEDDIVSVLTKGGQPKAPHVKPFKGANEQNAKLVAAYVKSLK